MQFKEVKDYLEITAYIATISVPLVAWWQLSKTRKQEAIKLASDSREKIASTFEQANMVYLEIQGYKGTEDENQNKIEQSLLWDKFSWYSGMAHNELDYLCLHFLKGHIHLEAIKKEYALFIKSICSNKKNLPDKDNSNLWEYYNKLKYKEKKEKLKRRTNRLLFAKEIISLRRFYTRILILLMRIIIIYGNITRYSEIKKIKPKNKI